MRTTLAILIGYILDLLIGDPHFLYHPVRLIGKLITGTEKFLRRRTPDQPGRLKSAGLSLVIVVIAVTNLCVFLLIFFSYKVSRPFGFIVEVLLCYWLFAVRSLRDESMKVYDRLKVHDLDGARKAVSMIVGRDTENLSGEKTAKAAVETVAENASDGVLAPLFYMAIGGPIFGWFCKAVNTMDSMVGYKNDTYQYFGRYAARLDDIVNFIPARLCALLMILSCPLCQLDSKNAKRIFRRDRYNHASPNSAQTESVMAGALHVQLGGDASYFGKLVKKQTIGDLDRPAQAEDIRRANSLLFATSAIGTALMLIIRTLILIAI